MNRTGVLYLLDADTGQQQSTRRVGSGSIWATPFAIGDLVYLFGYKGTTSVVSLSGQKEVAKNRLWEADAESSPSGGSPFGSGPVLYAASAAPPYLILRSGNTLYAVIEAD